MVAGGAERNGKQIIINFCSLKTGNTDMHNDVNESAEYPLIIHGLFKSPKQKPKKGTSNWELSQQTATVKTPKHDKLMRKV